MPAPIWIGVRLPIDENINRHIDVPNEVKLLIEDQFAMNLKHWNLVQPVQPGKTSQVIWDQKI